MIDFLTRRGKFFNPAWGVISSLTAKGVKAKVDNTFDGIYGNVTLSWSNATARFYTSSIGSGSVTIAQGKAFTDGTNIYSGTIENQTSALAGKTLAPCLALADTDDNTATIADHAGHTIAVTLQDRTLYKYGAWNTLCLPFALGNANAATGHHFDGTPLEGATVKELDTTGSYSPVALTPNDKSNLFLGTSTEDDQTVSTLYYPDDSNNQDGNYYIYACRGYFHVDLKASSDSSEGGGSVRAFVLNFGDGEVSGITTTNYTNYTNFTDSDAWYSLDGLESRLRIIRIIRILRILMRGIPSTDGDLAASQRRRGCTSTMSARLRLSENKAELAHALSSGSKLELQLRVAIK